MISFKLGLRSEVYMDAALGRHSTPLSFEPLEGALDSQDMPAFLDLARNVLEGCPEEADPERLV